MTNTCKSSSCVPRSSTMTTPEEKKFMSEDQKICVYKRVGITAFVGWIISFLGLIWSVSSTNTNYSMRLDLIESELVSLDARLDTSEAYRMQISADLAEIKTDLVWIRRSLENN